MFHVSQVAVPVLRDIGAAPRRGGFCSRERASLPADRALPNARDRPALLIVPGTHPGDGRIDGGFSAGAAPPSYPCGGRGGGAPCQPNVRTLKLYALHPMSRMVTYSSEGIRRTAPTSSSSGKKTSL